MFLGAINKNTIEYTIPEIGRKDQEYICSDCSEDVLL